MSSYTIFPNSPSTTTISSTPAFKTHKTLHSDPRTLTMKKSVSSAVNKAVEGNAWKKFTDVTVARGKTVYPKSPVEQERIGIRWDYDGEVSNANGVFNKFQMQPNAGKIPTSIKQWRDEHGGTHAVMASALVKKGGTRDDVKKALEEAGKSI